MQQRWLNPRGTHSTLWGYRRPLKAKEKGGGCGGGCVYMLEREGSFNGDTEQRLIWFTEPFVVRFQHSRIMSISAEHFKRIQWPNSARGTHSLKTDHNSPVS